jgi:hypothetical protein
MQARSTCEAGPYKKFLDVGVLQMVSEHQPLLHVAHEGVYQGVVLNIYHIYVVSCRGRQPLRGVNVTP